MKTFLPSVSILKGAHWLVHQVFLQAGYHWELRRSGETKIGLWRKTLRKLPAGRTDQASVPRRFVLVPGFGDTPVSWLIVLLMLAPVLRARYDEVVLLDFPGFSGFLAHEKSFHSMDLLMSATGDVFDSLSPDTILGHSLGGWLTARYAVECGKSARPTHQKRHGYTGPRKILLVCPSGAHESSEAREEFAQIFKGMVRDQGFEAIRSRLFHKEPIWFRYVEPEFHRFTKDEGIFQFTESVREDHLVERELDQVRAETWLIWGEKDKLVPPSGAPTWITGLTATHGKPQAVLLKGQGHSPQVENPAVTAAVVGQILMGKAPHHRGTRWWTVNA